MIYDDSEIVWKGGFPYVMLEFAGITPQSSIAEIQDAFFDIMIAGKDHEVHHVHQQVNNVQNRVFIDFFLYRVPIEGD